MSDRDLKTVAVLGAGSWGTALAMQMARIGHDVRLWTRREEHASSMRKNRENSQYLPGHGFAETLSPTSDLKGAMRGVDLVISVVPSQVKRAVWTDAREFLADGVPVASASKGIECKTLATVGEIFDAVIPRHPCAYIAGPSFAKEVAKGLPTAIVVASKDAAVTGFVQEAISDGGLRAYASDDVLGVEIGGALKNVIAIACGCADGIGFGQNTRAALITRGLAEITRLATKVGAAPETLAGLGGMGDLVLTCCGDLSRNRRVGLGLGAGKKLEQILEEMGQVAEGVATTASAKALAEREGVEMPIVEEMYQVLYEGKTVKACVRDLMSRGLRHELDRT